MTDKPNKKTACNVIVIAMQAVFLFSKLPIKEKVPIIR